MVLGYLSQQWIT